MDAQSCFGLHLGYVSHVRLRSIIALFKRLAADKGLAILITTHNPVFGYEADRALTLEDGRIVKEEDLRKQTSWTGGAGPGPESASIRGGYVSGG